MVAFRTCVRVGLIPQARHGGSGVCALAVVGSKLEGTGLEKLQMVQTHVAGLAGVDSTGGMRSPLSSCRAGDELLLRAGPSPRPEGRGWNEARFVALGIRVTLGEDLRKPPYRNAILISKLLGREKIACWSGFDTYVELIALHILEIQSERVLPRLSLVYIAHAVRGQVDLAILVIGELEFSKDGELSVTKEAHVLTFVQGCTQCNAHSPLIQPHIVLDEEQVLIGQIRGPQRGGQVDLL